MISPKWMHRKMESRREKGMVNEEKRHRRVQRWKVSVENEGRREAEVTRRNLSTSRVKLA